MSGLHGLTDSSLRQLIAWGDHLKVDQAQIDAQHEEIFNLATHIAELWQKHADVGQVRSAAEKLARVLDAHFRYEERELARIGYPKLNEHRAEHKVMLDARADPRPAGWHGAGDRAGQAGLSSVRLDRLHAGQ
ncbi:MAG: hemerythrin family protein [Azonexus sp.]